MDEYISREIAMERIKYKKPKVLYSEYGVGYERGLEDAIGLLNAISAADVQPVKRGQWISVKDRLPEDTEPCADSVACYMVRLANDMILRGVY